MRVVSLSLPPLLLRKASPSPSNTFPESSDGSRATSESENVEIGVQLALDISPPSSYSPTSPLPTAPRAPRRHALQIYRRVRNGQNAQNEHITKAHLVLK